MDIIYPERTERRLAPATRDRQSLRRPWSNQ